MSFFLFLPNFKKQNKLLVQFNKKLILIFHLSFLLSLIIVNLTISYFLRINNLSFKVNENPSGFWFAGYYSASILAFIITFIIYYLNFINKSFIGSLLILIGLYSNFFEKIIWNNVLDYLNIWFLNFNIADTLIIVGLFFLNYKIWFVKKQRIADDERMLIVL